MYEDHKMKLSCGINCMYLSLICIAGADSSDSNHSCDLLTYTVDAAAPTTVHWRAIRRLQIWRMISSTLVRCTPS